MAGSYWAPGEVTVTSAAAAPEVEQMLAHHAQLQVELAQRVAALETVVAAGVPFQAAQAAVGEFIASEIVPHALAEEDAIYHTGAQTSTFAPLVAGMVMEHEALIGLAGQLAAADSGVLAFSSATSFRALFEVHVRKENEILLPGLVESGANPGALLADMHTAFTGRRAAAAATAGTGSTAAATAHPEAAGEPGELVVDTRAHAAGSCANLATQTVDSIASGASFVLISDHDPRGLHYMLDAERPGLASWQLLEDGPVRWQVRVTKNAVSV